MGVRMRDDPENRRFNTWKEIAGFFGRDERTVKRWETERRLPVRRLPHGSRSTVYAYERDLEAWLDGGGARGDESADPKLTHPPAPAVAKEQQSPAWHRYLIPMVAAFLCGMAIGLVLRPFAVSQSPAGLAVNAPTRTQ
jgi:hypothetical protein